MLYLLIIDRNVNIRVDLHIQENSIVDMHLLKILEAKCIWSIVQG